MAALSTRLREIVDALPLSEGMRIVEIGCGPGAAAREVAARVGPRGRVLAIDRSPRAVAQAVASAGDLVDAGRLAVRNCAVEDLVLEPGERPYDLAFAVRVGALDGRHPEQFDRAVDRIAAVLRPGGRLLIEAASRCKRWRCRRGDRLATGGDRTRGRPWGCSPRSPTGSRSLRRSRSSLSSPAPSWRAAASDPSIGATQLVVEAR